MSSSAPSPGPAAARADAEPSIDPKERLLDAAEALFAERGFEGASIRAVTQAASMSVSAANYHFGSKKELLRATLSRRIEPVNAARIAGLHELVAREPEPSIEAVFDVFFRPLFQVRAERIAAGAPVLQYRQIAARLYADPPQVVAELKRELFAEVNERFTAVISRIFPGCSSGEAHTAMQLAIGAMVHVINGQLDLSDFEDVSRAVDFEAVLAHLVAFAAGGVRQLLTAEEAMPGNPIPGTSPEPAGGSC